MSICSFFFLPSATKRLKSGHTKSITLKINMALKGLKIHYETAFVQLVQQ